PPRTTPFPYTTLFRSYARELAKNDVNLATTNGLFWPEREAKTDEELKLIGRALRLTETGLARAMEVLKASKPAGRKLRWSGKTLDRKSTRLNFSHVAI